MSWPTCAACCAAPCVCGTNVPFRYSWPLLTWQPPAPLRLSDEDVERIAKRVVELMLAHSASAAPMSEDFTTGGHRFTITPIAKSALHSGRPLFRVYCQTCSEEVHAATTRPHDIAAFHTRDRSP